MGDKPDPSKEELREKLAEQCLTAVEKAINDAHEEKLWERVAVDGQDLTYTENYLRTLGRIRYLEMVAMKTLRDQTGIKPSLVRELNDDLTRMLMLTLFSSGMVTDEEMTGFYGAEFMADLVKRSGADLRPGAKNPGRTVYDEAMDAVKDYDQAKGD